MNSKDDFLENEFDFSKAILKKQITIRIAPSTIEYFKDEAKESGIPYQTLINLYLTDCVKNKRKLEFKWK